MYLPQTFFSDTSCVEHQYNKNILKHKILKIEIIKHGHKTEMQFCILWILCFFLFFKEFILREGFKKKVIFITLGSDPTPPKK